MSKSRISGNSEDFGASGLPKKQKLFGLVPGDFSNSPDKKQIIFKKKRIYQLGVDVPTDEILTDEQPDNFENR